MWIVDSFAAMVTGTDGLHDVAAGPAELDEETFRAFNSMVSPWHQWLDPVAYRQHVDSIEAMGILTSPPPTAACTTDQRSTMRSIGCAPSPGPPHHAGPGPTRTRRNARRHARRQPGPFRDHELTSRPNRKDAPCASDSASPNWAPSPTPPW